MCIRDSWKLWPKVYLFMAKSYFLRISALRISALRGCFEVAKKFGTHRQMHRSRTKQRPPSPTVQNATDEKKNKKRKRKILKKKRKTKRPPRAVDDSARGQRPRKRRPKACEYVIVLHNRGHEPIAVQLHVCGALGISLECLGKQPLPQAWCQGIPDSDVH